MVVSTFFGITLLWDWNESWPFPVLWSLLSFPNVLVYWISTLTASSSSILNRSAGIPSPLLALFILYLLRPIWLHNAGCLALGEWPHHHVIQVIKNFFSSSSVYSCHISSSTSVSFFFLNNFFPLLCPSFCMKCSLGISNFLEQTSSLSDPVAFLYFFA